MGDPVAPAPEEQACFGARGGSTESAKRPDVKVPFIGMAGICPTWSGDSDLPSLGVLSCFAWGQLIRTTRTAPSSAHWASLPSQTHVRSPTNNYSLSAYPGQRQGCNTSPLSGVFDGTLGFGLWASYQTVLMEVHQAGEARFWYVSYTNRATRRMVSF